MKNVQCINTACLHQQREREPMVCERCGSALIVDGRLLPVKLLSQPENRLSPQAVQTFEAADIVSQETVILRVVHSDDPSLVKPLENAVLALRHIHAIDRNPNIMQLVEGEQGYFTWQILPNEAPAHCMATVKVEGINLHEWMKTQAPVYEGRAVEWLRQLMLAVKALHSQDDLFSLRSADNYHGYLHRDIKPENIIVSGQQLVLIDLDAICPLGDGRTTIPADELSVVGTGLYMAPEQSQGKPRPRSDFYSIGCVMVELVTKQPISELRSPDGDIDWPKSLRLSVQFKQLLEQLTHINILNRPTSVDQILSYLDEATSWQTAEEQMRRHRRKTQVLTTLAMAVAALLLPGAMAYQRTSQARSEIADLVIEANQQLISDSAQEAIALMQKAIEIEPNNVKLLSTLALAQLSIGDLDTAISNFEAALAIDPGDPIARYDLASAYEAVDLQRAVESYQLAIRSAKTRENASVEVKATNGLARAYLLLEDPQQVIDLLSGLEDRTDDPLTKAIIIKNRAWANYQLGNLAVARSQLGQAIDIDPRQADAFCLRALVKQQAGDDNYDDYATCLNMYMPESKPEVEVWRAQLVEAPE